MTPIFVAHIEAKLTLFQRSPATPDGLITGLPGTSRAMTGWGDNGESQSVTLFETPMVNKCHAKRDTTGG
ncbi:hypothetical protein [Candidatus Spongiihabitans sp.]|uniref:hypothetical protein n=1 Tax=Candidatus Spongiihabitans sp. TaxID=3101308 RepID=UPI003C7B3F0C